MYFLGVVSDCVIYYTFLRKLQERDDRLQEDALEIDRIANIVEVLEERNNSVETKKPLVDSKEGVRIKNPIDLSDIEEFIY